MTSPRYPDPDAARRGDALARAWEQRERDPAAWIAARDAARSGPALWPGEWVGDRYRLLEPAGDGPIAATWSAWDGVAAAPVAVVVLHGQLGADSAAIRAFEAAARAPGGPGRPAVADPGGSWAGFRWFALAGAPGERLHAAVLGGLGPAAALQAVIEAGAALAALHAAGGVHGLPSPDTIRLAAGGPAQLTDAGLATGRAAAGAAWLAPERLDPNAPPTTSGDVYGLAMCALFALNGGELPFWAWRAPERLVAGLDLPEPAGSTLIRAVAWDPAERLGSVVALTDALLATDELRASLARACLDAGRPRDALDHLDALAARRPGDAGLLVDRARALDGLDPEAARLTWEAAYDQHHTREQGRAALEALTASRDHSSLGEWLDRSRALLPLLPAADRPALHHRLGRALLDEAGDRDAALPHLEQALSGGVKAKDLSRLVERLRTERGDWRDVLQLRVTRGELPTALAIARSALRSDPRPLRRALLADHDDVEALRDELAAVEAEGGDPGPLLDRLAAHGPSRPHEDVLRARALVAAGRSDEALVVLLAARAAHPGHLGTLEALGALHRSRGELAAARDAWTALAEAIAGQPAGRLDDAADHARAELAWLLGDAAGAARGWHRRLDRDPEDRAAWWGLARVAFDPPADQPWLGATPVVYTPEEALARLLAGLLDPAAATAWLGLTEAVAAGPLVTAARVVDALVARSLVGPAWFAVLTARFPEAGLPIEAVRWLWCEPTADPLFSLPDTYKWTGGPERFDRRVARRLLPLRSASAGADAATGSAAWEPLLARRDGPLAIEGAWTGGTPPMAPEREQRTAVAGPDVGHVDLQGDRVTVGGDDDDDLLIPGSDAARVRLERVGEAWYAVADAPFLADGRPTTERRLVPGLRLEVDGQPLKVHRLPVGAPIPADRDDLLLDLPVDGLPLTPHAVLVHRDGAREDTLPFDGDTLALGPDRARPVVAPGAPFVYRLVRTETGYTLEDRSNERGSEMPPILPLQHGDTFAIGDRSFTFQVLGASDTPALAPARDDRRNLVPLLVLLDEDEEHVIPLVEDVFSIGRSGGNDLQLGDDVEISRQHCVLVRGTDGACILRDSGSANGTHVNGRSIERHILQVGDVIQVGGSRLEFRLGKREDLDEQLQDLVLEEVEDTPSSRAETAAFTRPVRRT